MGRYNLIDQKINTYAPTPNFVDNADLWFASKINSVIKKQLPSEIYHEKLQLSKKKQDKFVRSLRNHSLNRQHMGAFVVGSIESEIITSSLVSSVFAQGKFYKMQQQTRRSVKLDSVIDTPVMEDRRVAQDYDVRFKFYNDVISKRDTKYGGFDSYIQDAFKILPLNVATQMMINLDLRTVKQYSRWQNFDYLPQTVREFSSQLSQSVLDQYPIIFDTVLNKSEKYEIMLDLIDKVGHEDITYENMLWYADHTLLIKDNPFFDRLRDKYFGKTLEDNNSYLITASNPLDLGISDLLSLFEKKDEETKSALELTTILVASEVDISGGIDTWRHTQNNRIIQPIYDALEEPKLIMPELYQRQKKSGANTPNEFMQHTHDSIDLFKEMYGENEYKVQELVNIVPHNLSLIQIEQIDLFSFLNMIGLRTCIHARPDVQKWGKSLLSQSDKIINGISSILEGNILPRAKITGYCAEIGNCKKCSVKSKEEDNIVYVSDLLFG